MADLTGNEHGISLWARTYVEKSLRDEVSSDAGSTGSNCLFRGREFKKEVVRSFPHPTLVPGEISTVHRLDLRRGSGPVGVGLTSAKLYREWLKGPPSLDF